MPPTTAPDTIRWTATQAASRYVPRHWGEMRDEVLILKDTRHPYWNNRLVAPNHFIYSFPSRSANPTDVKLHSIFKQKIEHATKPLRIHLFSTPGSRNEYFGEWVLAGVSSNTADGSGRKSNVGELELRRLAAQDEALVDVYADRSAPKYRSRNEGMHAEQLVVLFPNEDWILKHEPETMIDTHQPSVVDGVAVDIVGMSHSYTCDFIVAHRRDSRRVCIESKPHESHVDDVAIAKGRLLRDRTLTRVLIMAGDSSASPRWYDFGPPGTTKEEEAWYEEFTSLVI